MAWSSSQICVSKDTCKLSLYSNKRSFVCSACQISKSHKLPFPLSQSRASCHLEIIHADLWGPASHLSTNGACYLLLFLDDYSTFSWIYILHTKDQVSSSFVHFKTLVEKQFGLPIKVLQTDNGTEFTVLSSFLKSHASFIGFLVHVLQSKMVGVKESFAISLRQGLHFFFIKLLCP